MESIAHMGSLGRFSFLQCMAGLGRQMQSASTSQEEYFHAERATAVSDDPSCILGIEWFASAKFFWEKDFSSYLSCLLGFLYIAHILYEQKKMCRRFQALNRAERLSKHLDVGLTSYPKYHEEFPFWSSAFKAHSLQI